MLMPDVRAGIEERDQATGRWILALLMQPAVAVAARAREREILEPCGPTPAPGNEVIYVEGDNLTPYWDVAVLTTMSGAFRHFPAHHSRHQRHA